MPNIKHIKGERHREGKLTYVTTIEKIKNFILSEEKTALKIHNEKNSENRGLK